VDAELVAGSGGIFVVAVDGKPVAEKTRMGFPSEDEIVDGVGKALGR
jgi:predicted Rdx family selenoprotein